MGSDNNIFNDINHYNFSDKPANFCEWGFQSEELGTFTPASLVKWFPIVSLKFKWITKRPEFVTDYGTHSSGQIYGVGQYIFETFHLNNQAQMHKAFLTQQVIKSIEFLRFANYNGQSLEMAKYSAQSCVIVGYSFSYENSANYVGEKYRIEVHASGNNTFSQIVRNNGLVVGNMITPAYDTSAGTISES